MAELLAGLLTRLTTVEGTTSPLLAVANALVDLTPPWLKDLAVATLGTSDKIALFVGMGLALVAVCAGIGLLARWLLAAGLLIFLLVGVVVIAAVFSRPGATVPEVLPILVGVVVGGLVL